MRKTAYLFCLGKTRSFSVVELLVVMAIIASLAAVILPSFQHAKEKSKQIQCLNNQRQIGLAVEYYKNDNDRYLPVKAPTSITYWDHAAYMSILGTTYLQSNAAVFRCPANRNTQGMDFRTNSFGQMDYEINSGLFGIHIRGKINLETGGIQKPSLAIYLYDWPNPEALAPPPAVPPHPDGGFNALFVDGHVEWLTLAQSQEARGGYSPYWKWGR